MNQEKITITGIVKADRNKTWKFYTLPEHITKWNFADPSWHCPFASNDLQIGGKYFARMEAKDGSYGFDFEATYLNVLDGYSFTYRFGERESTVTFNEIDNQTTEVTVVFDSESNNSIEMQKQGWEAILENFKRYIEHM